MPGRGRGGGLRVRRRQFALLGCSRDVEEPPATTVPPPECELARSHDPTLGVPRRCGDRCAPERVLSETVGDATSAIVASSPDCVHAAAQRARARRRPPRDVSLRRGARRRAAGSAAVAGHLQAARRATRGRSRIAQRRFAARASPAGRLSRGDSLAATVLDAPSPPEHSRRSGQTSASAAASISSSERSTRLAASPSGMNESLLVTRASWPS